MASAALLRLTTFSLSFNVSSISGTEHGYARTASGGTNCPSPFVGLADLVIRRAEPLRQQRMGEYSRPDFARHWNRLAGLLSRRALGPDVSRDRGIRQPRARTGISPPHFGRLASDSTDRRRCFVSRAENGADASKTLTIDKSPHFATKNPYVRRRRLTAASARHLSSEISPRNSLRRDVRTPGQRTTQSHSSDH
jgi:hypothetical protein